MSVDVELTCCVLLGTGFTLVSIFNVLLILAIGAVDEECTKISAPQQSAYSNSEPAAYPRAGP